MNETTADVGDLIRQRDALSAQIDAATKATGEAYADDLDTLRRWAARIGAESGLDVAEGERKNVQSLTLGGWLNVYFGYPGDGHNGHLAIVTAGGIRAQFWDELPPLDAFAGYLRGLIEYDRHEGGQ